MTTDKNKGPLGFRTSATELHEKFEKLSSKLRENKSSWSKLGDMLGEDLDKQLSQVKSLIDSKSDDHAKINAAFNYLHHAETMYLVCTLGELIFRLSERLLECEKSIQELHLKIK